MSKKFYKSIIQVEVLSENAPMSSFCGEDLDNIHWQITYGDCSGATKIVSETELSGKEMAEALLHQGSDPSFFGLNNDGSLMED